MKKLLFFNKIYREIVNSIAFYPSLLSLFSIILSLLVMGVEYHQVTLELKKGLQAFLVSDLNSARLILGSIVGGIISLMVFSFSMVMVVLNRATATLSPRVLPGLISNRFHQVVLGVYLSTIIFSLVLIVNIRAPEQEFSNPSLGILISMVMTLVCLGLFVSFIHSISKKIQVDNILLDLFKRTMNAMQKTQERNVESNEQNETQYSEPTEWYICSCPRSGYLRRVNFSELLEICENDQITAKITLPIGDFAVEGYPLILTSREISDDHKEKLYECVVLYTEEHISDHYSLGFKQISEIAVKALSPGINDPGTAVTAIDLLSHLFVTASDLQEPETIIGKDNTRLIITREPFKNLLFKTLVPLEKYGRQDIKIMKGLLEIFHAVLLLGTVSHDDKKDLSAFVATMLEHSDVIRENDWNKNVVNDQLIKINSELPSHLELTLGH